MPNIPGSWLVFHSVIIKLLYKYTYQPYMADKLVFHLQIVGNLFFLLAIVLQRAEVNFSLIRFSSSFHTPRWQPHRCTRLKTVGIRELAETTVKPQKQKPTPIVYRT